MKVLAIVVAAGRGNRAGFGLAKQYVPLSGRPLIAWAIEPFCEHAGIEAVLPVIHADDRSLFSAAVPDHPKLLPATIGGDTRQASVLLGLEAAERSGFDIVLVHDGARPFVTPQIIDRAIDAGRSGAAVPAIPVTDSLINTRGSERLSTIAREDVKAVQTPQAFLYDALLRAHRLAASAGVSCTDDGAVAAHAGLRVEVFEGDAGNMKLTTANDFETAEMRIAGTLGDVRIGNGFDVHAFGEGDHVMLCGVRVPHERGLIGHSDADVGLHALTDAILGALAEGDIGHHFPPSDPQWRGAASHIFLAEAVRRVKARGGIIANLDLTILGEAPKVGPWRDQMRETVGAIAGLGADRIGIKATTTEALGFIGRREGLAAQATATIRLPFVDRTER